MFTTARRISLHSEPRLYTPTAARRRAINAMRAILIVAVASLSVFTAGRIFFGGPLGSARDLFTLYGATAALALGLTGLFELRSSEDELEGGADSSRPGGVSTRISGIFRRTRDEGFRFLSKAMKLAQVG
jgi:hypothetical protein